MDRRASSPVLRASAPGAYRATLAPELHLASTLGLLSVGKTLLPAGSPSNPCAATSRGSSRAKAIPGLPSSGCASTPTRSRPELASPLERGVDAGGATAARVFLDHMKLKLVAFDSPSISPDSFRKVEGAEGRVEEVDFVPSDHDLPTAARFPDARSAVGTFPNGQADGRQPTRLDTQPVPSQLRRCGITRGFLRVGGRCGRLACRACRAGLRSGRLGAAARRQPGRAERTDQDNVDSHERMICRDLPVALGLRSERPSNDGREELPWATSSRGRR